MKEDEYRGRQQAQWNAEALLEAQNRLAAEQARINQIEAEVWAEGMAVIWNRFISAMFVVCWWSFWIAILMGVCIAFPFAGPPSLIIAWIIYKLEKP